jgi:hypothetical protein
MLEVLSQNRDLRGYIKEAETMLTRVDIEKLPSYELGMEKGTYLERRRLAKGLLGLLSDEVIAEKTGLPIKTVQDLHRADE